MNPAGWKENGNNKEIYNAKLLVSEKSVSTS